MKNETTIKSVILCAHLLACSHTVYATKFDQLVDLVDSCSSYSLKYFKKKAEKNVTYTLYVARVKFVDTISIWVKEVMLECPHKAAYLYHYG